MTTSATQWTLHYFRSIMKPDKIAVVVARGRDQVEIDEQFKT
jgi:hypothetical protein